MAWEKPPYVPTELWERMQRIAEENALENARTATPLELRRGKRIMITNLTKRLVALPRLPEAELVPLIEVAIKSVIADALDGPVECRRSVRCYIDAMNHGVVSQLDFGAAVELKMAELDRPDVLRAFLLMNVANDGEGERS